MVDRPESMSITRLNTLCVVGAMLAGLGPGCTGAASPEQPFRDRASTATMPGGEVSAQNPPSASERADPRFSGTVAILDERTRARMVHSWREGCPVPLEDLRLLTMSFWGYDDWPHRGEMVVHRDVARDVIRVFRALFEARFPVRRMRLVDDYGGSDARSMAANNTSAFNCRAATGAPGVWSEHAYGRAIDVNPVVNPYLSASRSVEPAEGAAYVDRSPGAEGMIHQGDIVVEAFASIGWGWGGAWASTKDYQHFSRSGR
ncbi:MAG: M15 family metallopeptidase [Actinomycetota bacterium]